MRSTAGPQAGAADPGEGWGVRRAARLEYQGTSGFLRDPVYVGELALYLDDMLRPHGFTLDHAALEHDGQSHEEMARALIARILPEGEQVDLLVLTHATFDVMPARSSCVHLSHLCPGAPMAFAITDQGTAAPFTALRLIRQYASSGDARRALLIVLEQAWLPYAASTPAPILPTGHAGVALLFGDADALDTASPARVGPVVMRHGASAADLAAELAALADAAPHENTASEGAAPENTAILGSLLAGQAADTTLAAGPHDVRLGSTARPYTGLWWELAGQLTRPRTEPRRLVAADYDPGTLTLCLAAIDADAHTAAENADTAMAAAAADGPSGRQTA